MCDFHNYASDFCAGINALAACAYVTTLGLVLHFCSRTQEGV